MSASNPGQAGRKSKAVEVGRPGTVRRLATNVAARSRRIGIAMLVCIAATASGTALAQMSESVRVSGAVAQPLTLSVDDLKRMPVQRVELPPGGEARRDGRPPAPVRTYSGVLLRDVLDRAKLVEARTHDLRSTAVLVTATDGYQVLFSWSELYLTQVGDGVLVVFERDGVPLDSYEGRIALVSTRDNNTGPRHVRWLRSIDVARPAQP